MQSYIFYNDRLLLRKDPEERYHVPYESELPDELQDVAASHEVVLPNGTTIRATDIRRRLADGRLARFVRLPAAQ